MVKVGANDKFHCKPWYCKVAQRRKSIR